MAITDWPVDERPRERLLQKGAQSLSDAELLAIFLRVGVKGKSAVDVSRELLQIFGGLRALLTATRDQFCAHHGMGDAKYALLQAVLEMGRRHLAEDWQRGSCLDSPQRVRQYLSASLRDRGREIFLSCAPALSSSSYTRLPKNPCPPVSKIFIFFKLTIKIN